MPSRSPTSVAVDHSNNDEEDSSGKNPYVALREANIARNEARLRELGLLGPSSNSRFNRQRRQQQQQQQQPEVPPRPKPNRQKQQQKQQQVPVRRSARNTPRPESYLLPGVPSVEAYKPSTKRKRSSSTTIIDDDTYVSRKSEDHVAQKASTIIPKTFPANSARSISINVQKLVLGKDGFLGQPMKATGKATVMLESARRSSPELLDEANFGSISFNKYCGAQEWYNDAIFLWVNLSSSNEFVNEFLDGGRRMTWFGGKKMHDGTSVIQKLIRVGSAAVASKWSNNLDPSNGIVLWVRQEIAGKKGTFGPYYCLGRLAYSSHEPGSSPLAFVWTLLDYDRLVAEGSETIRQMMQL